jgi:hypothetical protein
VELHLKMACGLQAACGVICQQKAVIVVDPQMTPGGHQACYGYDVERCWQLALVSPLTTVVGGDSYWVTGNNITAVCN